jgi:hypothetical protein
VLRYPRSADKGEKPQKFFEWNNVTSGLAYGFFSNTPENEVVALTRRTMVPTLAPERASAPYGRFLREMRTLALSVPKFNRLTVQEVLTKYSGKLRVRYEEAAASLEVVPLMREDSRLSSFVKSSKESAESLGSKPPRVIQGRTPRYNLELMRYLRPVEHWLYRRKHNGRRTIVKGLNLEERASLIKEKLSDFSDPITLSIDAAKFEAHCADTTLRAEHSVYLAAYRNSGLLRKLLAWQEVNFGKFRSGLSYKIVARRCSGDFNTGCGNTMISYCTVKSYFAGKGIHYDFVVDGDDLLLIVERGSISIPDLTSHYRQVGYSITLVQNEPQALVHCQGSVVETDPPIMVRHPEVTLAKAFVATKYYDCEKTATPYARTIADCESKIHRGVPMLGPYFNRVLELLGPGPMLNDDADRHRFKMAESMKVKQLPITLEARLSFEEAFSITVDEQINFELGLSKLSLTHRSNPDDLYKD